jgi:hypothetical protein
MEPLIRLILVLLFCLFGCTTLSETTKSYPLPESSVWVTGDKILHNDKPFAELRYYFSAELSNNPGEAYLFRSHVQHRGLAIYYYNYDKLVWIFPDRGLDDDIKRGYYSARSQSDGYFGWVFDIKISEDGKYVYYKTRGIFFTRSHKYLVEYGVTVTDTVYANGNI